MTKRARWLSVAVILVLLAVGLLMPAQPAAASVRGRRNTALALSGAALYELVKGHGPAALILAGGSYYAWQRVKQAKSHHTYYRLHRVGYSTVHHHHHYARYSRHHHA